VEAPFFRVSFSRCLFRTFEGPKQTTTTTTTTTKQKQKPKQKQRSRSRRMCGIGLIVSGLEELLPGSLDQRGKQRPSGKMDDAEDDEDGGDLAAIADGDAVQAHQVSRTSDFSSSSSSFLLLVPSLLCKSLICLPLLVLLWRFGSVSTRSQIVALALGASLMKNEFF
jgi:hypothetical protein